MHGAGEMISRRTFGQRSLSQAGLVAMASMAATGVSLADDASRIRWEVFSGTGSSNSPSADQPSDPLEIAMRNPYGIEVTPNWIYFSTVDDHSIWQLSRKQGTIRRFAGTGKQGYSGDAGPALSATFNAPHEIRADSRGNLFVADTRNHCIRRIDAKTGVVITLAGNGKPGYGGDNIIATQARFNQPHSIVLDPTGCIVADTLNHRVRRIDLRSGLVRNLAGTGRGALPTSHRTANLQPVFGPRSLAIGPKSIWLVLREGNSIWRIDRLTGKIVHLAGTGEKGFRGDGGDPLEAEFRGPKGIALDSQQRMLIADTENHAIRRIDQRKNLVELLQTPYRLKRPHGVAVIPAGSAVDMTQDTYLVSDSENHQVLSGV